MERLLKSVCDDCLTSHSCSKTDAQAYSNNVVDHHLVLDLLPSLARAYFSRRLPATLSPGQAAILTVLGLQQRDVSACERDLGMQSNQILALFNKVTHHPPLLSLPCRSAAKSLVLHLLMPSWNDEASLSVSAEV